MVLAAALGASTAPLSTAAASTPDAWAEMERSVNRACVAVSGIDRPQILAHKVSTSDEIGVEIRLMRGYDREKRFHRKVCVFHRGTGRAEAHDAAGWFGPPVRP